MNIKHPSGKSIFIMNEACQFMAEIDIAQEHKWVTFGYIGGNQALLVDETEWDGFVAMVREVDEVRKSCPT